MEKEKELPKRKTMRLQGADYSSPGVYFLTVCTRDRACLLSKISSDGCTVDLLPHGTVAEKYIRQLNDFYDDIEVEQYVIMPNHIHLLLFIKQEPCLVAPTEGPSRTTQNSAVSRFISTFKRFCNKEYGTNIWQYRSYDHIIRNRKDYEEHVKYILENPLNWYYDELYSL